MWAYGVEFYGFGLRAWDLWLGVQRLCGDRRGHCKWKAPSADASLCLGSRVHKVLGFRAVGLRADFFLRGG